MTSNSDFFKSNPPSCVDGFEKKYIDSLEIDFDGHGEEINPVFQLSCKCGSNTFSVYGHKWTNPDNGEIFYISPLSATCTECAKQNPIFDIQNNGYDAVLGHGTFGARGEGTPEIFECHSCNESTTFELFARFEYPDDMFDEDFDDFRGKEKDLFTWFSLHGKCTSCNTLVDISEDECA